MTPSELAMVVVIMTIIAIVFVSLLSLALWSMYSCWNLNQYLKKNKPEVWSELTTSETWGQLIYPNPKKYYPYIFGENNDESDTEVIRLKMLARKSLRMYFYLLLLYMVVIACTVTVADIITSFRAPEG